MSISTKRGGNSLRSFPGEEVRMTVVLAPEGLILALLESHV
jgi:hypothetical protein